MIGVNKSTSKYSNLSFIFCSFVPVGFEDYVSFFKREFKNFTYLKFKFPHSKGKVVSSINDRNIFTLHGVSSKIFYFSLLPFNYLLLCVQCLTLLWKRDDSDKRIFMGVNHICTFYGLILRLFKRVDYVIYRVTDFFPLPRSGPYRIINRVFYIMDIICLKCADSVWFTTEGHIIGREKYGYFSKKSFDYEIIPLGLDVRKFVSRKVTKRSLYSLVYCGVVSRYHMLDLLFDVISDLKKKFPLIKLNIIGTGPDEEYFRDLASKMCLSENVIFHGFVPEGETFTNLMSENILGLALYKDEEDFMKYTEPAKVKYYLGFGVPAVVSDVPKIAGELDKARVAFAVKNNKQDIVSRVEKFIASDKLQKEYKENIKKFVRTIDINKLLEDKISKTFKKLALC